MATNDGTRPLAFVLMPFDAEFDDVYRDLIAAPLAEAGFEVRRADSLLNQQSVLADIVRGIASAELIVADVTGLNPNVMYELGLAHGLGKRTLLLTQKIAELPFDLRPYRNNEYSTNFKLAGKLAETVKSVGEAVLRGDADFSNPVLDFAPGSLSSTSQVETGPRSRDAKSSPNEEEDDQADLGFLDGLSIMAAASTSTVRISEEIAAQTASIGGDFEKHTAKINQIQKNLGPDKGLQASLAVMRDTAKVLDAFSDSVDPLNDEVDQALIEMVRGANVVARRRGTTTQADIDAINVEIDSINELEKSLIQSYFSTSEFSKTLGEMPQMEIHLTKASRRAAGIVARTASILESAQAEFDRVSGLLAERRSAASVAIDQ